MPSIYLEYAPKPTLQNFVNCYWSLQVTENAIEIDYKVLPDGCVDFIFESFSGASGMLIGSMTKAVSVSLRPKAQFFGVRFRPGGASPFVEFSLKEATDAQLKLEDVWRDTDAELASIASSGEVKHQIVMMEKFLEKKLIRSDSLNPKIQAAVDFLCSHDGNCSIDVLSKTLEMSRQHLNRIFTEAVGLNLKTFARIVRLQSALKRARRSPSKDWVDLALESGYYDQAHFISDFKILTGTTPTKFFGRET